MKWAAALLVLGLQAGSAAAMTCNYYGVMVKDLNENWKEFRQSGAVLQGGQGYIEVFASKQGTWTEIVSGGNPKKACILMYGIGYEQVRSDREG